MRYLQISILIMLLGCSEKDTSLSQKEQIFHNWSKEGNYSYSVDPERQLTLSLHDEFDLNALIALIDLNYFSSLGYLSGLYDEFIYLGSDKFFQKDEVCKLYGVLEKKYRHLGLSANPALNLDPIFTGFNKFWGDNPDKRKIWQFFMFYTINSASLNEVSSDFERDLYMLDSSNPDFIEMLVRLEDPLSVTLLRDLALYIFLDIDRTENPVVNKLLDDHNVSELYRSSDFSKSFLDAIYCHSYGDDNIIDFIKIFDSSTNFGSHQL